MCNSLWLSCLDFFVILETFRTFSRPLSGVLGLRGRKAPEDFFETFWLRSPRFPLPSPRNLKARSKAQQGVSQDRMSMECLANVPKLPTHTCLRIFRHLHLDMLRRSMNATDQPRKLSSLHLKPHPPCLRHQIERSCATFVEKEGEEATHMSSSGRFGGRGVVPKHPFLVTESLVTPAYDVPLLPTR